MLLFTACSYPPPVEDVRPVTVGWPRNPTEKRHELLNVLCDPDDVDAFGLRLLCHVLKDEVDKI